MFGFRLRVPARGDDITADWARELVKAVRSMRLFAGPGIQLTQTPDGTTVSVKGGDGISAPTKPEEHWGVLSQPATTFPWATGPDSVASDGATVPLGDVSVTRDSSSGSVTITPGTRSVTVDAKGNTRSIGEVSAGTPIVLRAGVGIDGEDGEDGVGIQSVTAGTPTTIGSYTSTSITVTLTDGTTHSFAIVAKNGEDGERGPRGYQGEQGPPGPTVSVAKQVVIDVRYNETAHQLECKYSTITCQGFTDDASWTPFTTAVAEMP